MPNLKRAKKYASGRCEFCGEERPLVWRCRRCGFTVCQVCLSRDQKYFSCNAITWVCPNCLNWETL
ncbi:hypothetical protein FVE67_07480 [Thermosulfurimonas marina]|uniref:B box-type domain-containing protein n=1 Tax=Thermosulfurimonas marina TaxID=2047767 RepID=A0A6H1WTW7_9BACT|nr:hypothetical protein FVE67_07480 [Thermosulfurimonas marina]